MEEIIKIHQLIAKDIYLNHLYNLKDKLMSCAKPEIIINLNTGEFNYIIENDTIKKINKEIENRINIIKNYGKRT